MKGRVWVKPLSRPTIERGEHAAIAGASTLSTLTRASLRSPPIRTLDHRAMRL